MSVVGIDALESPAAGARGGVWSMALLPSPAAHAACLRTALVGRRDGERDAKSPSRGRCAANDGDHDDGAARVCSLDELAVWTV